MQDNSEQVTIKQAAKMCSVTTSTLYKMVRTGRLPQTEKGLLSTAAVLEYKGRLETSRKLLLSEQQKGEEEDGKWFKRFNAKS